MALEVIGGGLCSCDWYDDDISFMIAIFVFGNIANIKTEYYINNLSSRIQIIPVECNQGCVLSRLVSVE